MRVQVICASEKTLLVLLRRVVRSHVLHAVDGGLKIVRVFEMSCEISNGHLIRERMIFPFRLLGLFMSDVNIFDFGIVSELRSARYHATVRINFMGRFLVPNGKGRPTTGLCVINAWEWWLTNRSFFRPMGNLDRRFGYFTRFGLGIGGSSSSFVDGSVLVVGCSLFCSFANDRLALLVIY